MMCLWCGVERIHDLSWNSFLLPARKDALCMQCSEKLAYLKGGSCEKCYKITLDKICEDCLTWSHFLAEDPLEYNRSVFQYNDFMQEVISKWKYRGDYILGEVFRTQFLLTFKNEFARLKQECVLVPIPLSAERLQERGFNQADMLMEFLPGDKRQILTRNHSEKQSKKNRSERIKSENPFRLQKSIQKPVIIVDDIYTTGATLRHASRLLKESGCPKVYSFTLVRG